jgi:hypothetical protein
MSGSVPTAAEFNRTAEVLRNGIKGSLLCEIALDFAKRYATDNQSFNPRRFFEACGMTPTNIELYLSFVTKYSGATNG